MSKSRMRTIDDHDSQIKFVSAKASQLAFCDRARSEVESAVQSLKDSHGNADGGSCRALYQSDEFSDLQAEIKRINADRNGIELALQAYFDHHSQGASRTESAKIERVQLKLPANLDKGLAGYKLITAMEDYLVGRGNEFWSIIPDLRRSAHDIDPSLALNVVGIVLTLTPLMMVMTMPMISHWLSS